tara:strand:- start:3983 stop:5857 length:1875 start_codon:yes stop_codon:yes gene_type:complete
MNRKIMKYKLLIADIETNAIGKHNGLTMWSTQLGLDTMHCMSILDAETKELYEFNTHKQNIAEGISMLKQAEYVVFHNGIGFDVPALHKLFGISIHKVIDTMLMAKILFPDIGDSDFKRENFPKKLIGSQSLKAWGIRLGNLKGDHGETETWEDFSNEMQQYCNQDVRVTFSLYEHLLKANTSSKALVMEHEFAKLIRLQELNGFPFNVKKGEELARDLMVRKLELDKELQEVFPPTIVEMKRPAGWTVEVEGIDFTAKTKGQLKEELKRAGFKQTIANLAEKTGNEKREIPFNAGSRDQIAERLMANGWKPQAYDGKRPEINEAVLKKINTKESLKLLEYLLVQKRLGQLVDGRYAWLTCVTPEGRIHGSVNTVGTVTGRCTHSQPNVSAVPSVRADYGEETRGLFKAPEGKVLVGADASSIELRMLGSVLFKYDSGKYVREILEGDIHQVNADALGITRSEAKTWIYAYLYGCGNQLLGEIVGKGMKEGKRLRQTFLKKMPSFKKLTTDIDKAVDTQGHLTSIDGRILKIRSKHKALNSLLQSSASIVMKQALIEFSRDHAKHPYELHANIHDEVQFSCKKEHANDLGRAFVTALGTAGKTLGIKCPLDGEFKVGNNWAETH